MDNKSIIIGILVVIVVVLGIGLFLVSSTQPETNTTDNSTNNTNNTTNPVVNNNNNNNNNQKNNTQTYIGTSKAISIVKSASGGGMTGFSASLTTYSGKPAYAVKYYHSGEDVPEWVTTYVDAYSGAIITTQSQ